MAAEKAEKDPVAKRIEWALDHAGLAVSAASKKAGLSPGTVGKTLARGNGLSMAVGNVLALAEVTRTNPAWLVTGTGKPTEAMPLRLGSRQGFERHLAKAKLLRPDYPDKLWVDVAESDPLLTVRLSPRVLVKIAELLLEAGEDELPA